MVEKATKKGKVPCFHISHLQFHIHFFLFIMLNNLNNKVSIHCVHIVCLFLLQMIHSLSDRRDDDQNEKNPNISISPV